MNAAELASHLGAVKSGRQWKCRCVAHEDKLPSMIIFDGRESVQVRCLAGCDQDAIIGELERRGLWGGDERNRQGPSSAPVTERDRKQIAQWLWSIRQPIAGTAAERYLRRSRGISCPLPGTLAYLPGRNEHCHAMIAAFATTVFEPEDGKLVVMPQHVVAVHLTKLDPDGAKLDKIIVGSPRGVPIRLSPIGDYLALAITEGIEEGLSMVEATGLGVWAAGNAPLMAQLADAVPAWADCVTVLTDHDNAGKRHAAQLVHRLLGRGIGAEAIGANGVAIDG